MNEYKIAVVGAGDVGKSALAFQYAYGEFHEDWHECEYSYRKQIVVDGEDALLDVLGTAPQEHSTIEMRENDARVSQGFVLMYSITSRASFDKVVTFFDLICGVKESHRVPMILVGNKSDLVHRREVSTEDGVALANSLGIPFLEISVSSRVDVENVLSEVVRLIRAYELELSITSNNKKKRGGGASLSKCTIQ